MALPFLLKASDVDRLRIAINQRQAFQGPQVADPNPPLPSSVFSVGNFVDPNGNQTAVGYAMYFDAGGSVWFHNSTATSDTNWEQKI